MSGRLEKLLLSAVARRPLSRRGTARRALFSVFFLTILGSVCTAPPTHAQERREREANSVYAARRAKLAAQIDSPILLWGFTGREESAQTYIFAQEDNFYYLTGHNEEAAGLIIMPGLRTAQARLRRRRGMVRRKCFFCRRKIPPRKNGTASACRPPIPASRRAPVSLRFCLSRKCAPLSKSSRNSIQPFYTILPYEKENGGYPHEKEVVDWIHSCRSAN